jgi:acyl-CoA synthetase (AMP-forming)/AMP-acid ligase II
MTLYNSAIADILIQLNKNAPQKVIITEGWQKVTVNEIYNDAINIALNLQLNGFKSNDRVVIAAPPNAEFLKIMYALIFLKAIVAIIDPEMGRDNYNSKLKQFNPQWAFVDARLLLLQEHPILRYFYLKKSKTAPYFPYTPSANIIACGGWLPLFQKKTFLNKWINKPLINSFNWEINEAPDLLNLKNLVNLEPNLSDNKNENLIRNNAQNSKNTDLSRDYREGGHDFLITYTSGTIAEPKGVVHSFNSLLNSIQLIGKQLNPEKETLIATYLPHYMLIGFAVKIPSILYNPKLSPIKKLAFFADNKVTTIMGPPSDFVPMMEHCEQTKTQFPDSMQHILLGSAPVTRRFLRRLSAVLPAHTRITCLYGMTENLLVATIDGRFKMDYDCEGDLLGKPAEGVEIKIINDEIVLKSNQLFSRYFHLTNRNEFHETGDLGNFDKNNYLILRGRKKDMIIRRNLNIYPAIYEATINRMEGVTEAVLVGVYDDLIHDEKVYLIIEGEAFLNKTIILNQLKTGIYSIDAEAMPDEVLFMQLPRSGRQHKVNKEAIIALIK